jgi:cysteine sulfinate desulfinase/cysteine desulfurase-like protein
MEGLIVKLQGLEVQLVDVIQEVENNVLAVIVHWSHNEVGSSFQVREFVKLVFIKFVNVGLSVFFIVLLSSEY